MRRISITIIAALGLTSAPGHAPAQVEGVKTAQPMKEFEAIRTDDGRAVYKAEAEQYAKALGLEFKAGAAQYAAQLVLADQLGAIKAALAGASAGVWIEHTPTLRGVVRLAAGAAMPAEADRMIRTAASPIAVIKGGEPVAAMRKRLAAAAPELIRKGGGLAAVQIDVTTGEFLLLFDESDQKEARRDVEAAARRLLGDRLRIEDTKGVSANGAVRVRGGAPLSQCTSSFAVREPIFGRRGYVTSGHCIGKGLKYEGYGKIHHLTPVLGERRNEEQDVQWVSTDLEVLPEFHAESRLTARPLKGRKLRGNQIMMEFVCHRGKTTGYSCGFITTTTAALGYLNACPNTTCAPVWVMVEGQGVLGCARGDSGGPWFVGERAYGIHKGQNNVPGRQGPVSCDWAAYMAVDFLGAELLFD